MQEEYQDLQKYNSKTLNMPCIISKFKVMSFQLNN